MNSIRILLGRGVALIAMVAVLAGTLVMPAAAQVETISAVIPNCKLNVSAYSVQLQTGVPGAPASDFPASVTLTFADGTTAEAGSLLPPNINGTKTYRLNDPAGTYRESELVSATAQLDTARYPNYRFTVTGWPCDPTPEPATYSVTGTILQRGNLKPVTPAEVCLVELGICTVTDGGGSFAFSDVPDGTYTLVSTAHIFKTLTTSVTVDGGDTYVDLIQFRGRD